MNTSQKKIILVDDSHYHLAMTKEKLKGQYEVYPAQSAEILFEVLGKITPDLILLDVNMPGTDGFETIEKLKSDARYAGIPVIFLAAKHDMITTNRGLALGAAAFMKKPFNDAELLDCIAKHIN